MESPRVNSSTNTCIEHGTSSSGQFDEEIVQIENVTVKFRISESQIIAQIYPNRLTIMDIKKDLARKFEITPEVLCVMQHEAEVADSSLLMETNKNEFGIYEFCLKLQKSSRWDSKSKPAKLDLNVYYNKFHLPDFITVHISGEDSRDGNPKDIVIEIQNKAIDKPELARYRHKITGIEYVEAFTQTGPPNCDKWENGNYSSRDTQTNYNYPKLITPNNETTQCFKDGSNVLFVSNAKDFTITPRKFQTYYQKKRLDDKLKKIILIQRNFRRYLLVRLIRRAAAEYRHMVADRLQAEHKLNEQIEQIHIKRTDRVKQFPQTKEDFDLLYTEVDNWKKAELKRISQMHHGVARIAEFNLLLDKEIGLLNGIERQKQIIRKAMQDSREEQLLNKMGQPIEWIGYKDTNIHLDLLRHQRVRFLHEIYKDLKKPMKKEKRLELISKIKNVLVEEQDFQKLPELFDLFEREKNILIYTRVIDLETLHKRQNFLFLELIKFSKDRKPKEIVRNMCDFCKKVKPLSQFAVRTREEKLNSCNACYCLKFKAGNMHIYNSILRALQRDERQKRSPHSYAFIMQVDDIRHLIEKIWHGYSILSKCNDLQILRLPRWNIREPWSPWNCICLTETETQNHYNINDLEKTYNQKLRTEIQSRHVLGRKAFQNLATLGENFFEY
ncbi:IQ and ubiquitin-like domain-containing protein [Teleopsis dalmanni]|uniref:IQ and ubiquitin-like domain-containing protein n=1 Tax=Teleopsis dalmanni TaxID=139649 RepID=UPI0018CD2DC6|nr:IQ and ubiquitin-like domain-containing protein [Teleopsis dalmanni]